MYVVYWIHKSEDADMLTQGYIGVTSNINTRLYMHKSGNGNILVQRNIEKYNDEVLIDIIFSSDNEQECYDLERNLRPTKNIGWNFAEGGSKPPSPLGNRERAMKASQTLRGRKITWGDKISATNKGKVNSPESIRKGIETRRKNGIVVWNKGKKTGPQTESTIQKRSKAMLGKNSKKVGTPLGVFNSITEAAAAHNVKVQTMHARISYYKMKGYNYV